MGFVKIVKSTNYTVMSNHCLQNPELSNKARGLLCTMLSLHPKWDFSVDGLAKICKDGRDGIKTQLDELEKHKYLRRGGRIRNELGHLKEAEFTVYEVPYDELPDTENPMQEFPSLVNPSLESPSLEHPAQGNPAQENPEQLNTYISNTNKSNTQSINSSSINYRQMLEERRRWTEVLKEQLDYEILKDFPGMELLDVVINTMVSVICSPSSTIKIKGSDIPKEIVKERLLNLDEFHIGYALDVYDKQKNKVGNTKAYLIPLLYEAPDEMDAYYSALYAKNSKKRW